MDTTLPSPLVKGSDIAYIFHIVRWRQANSNDPNQYTPDTSDWHVYKLNGADTLKFTGIGSDGEPRIYNKKDILLVGIDIFEQPIDTSTFGDAYKITVTQGKPQNQTDLGALITALLGTGNAAKAQVGGEPSKCSLFLAAALQRGTSSLPFDAKVTVVAAKPTKSGGQADGIPSTPTEGENAQSGNITAAGNAVTLRVLGNATKAKAEITGTFDGTLTFETALTGQAFSSAKADENSATSVSGPGTWTIDTAGKSQVRVKATQWNSGIAAVKLSAVPEISQKPEADGAAKPQAAGGGSGGRKPSTEAGNTGPHGQTPSEPAPGVVTCTGTDNTLPCTTTRTFTSVDREWWDVSIGIAIPGVRESKFSIANNQLSQSTTTHTDLYGMLDLYPFAKWAAKDDWAPHFNLGVPITSKSLYRPYFGLAESVGGLLTRITGSQKQFALPLDMNVFGGMVWMKTQTVTGNPTTASALTADSHTTRVWKPAFGVEVPVSSIASKIKGITSKNTNGSGKSSTGSSGGN
jgi:hypothetical protein